MSEGDIFPAELEATPRAVIPTVTHVNSPSDLRRSEVGRKFTVNFPDGTEVLRRGGATEDVLALVGTYQQRGECLTLPDFIKNIYDPNKRSYHTWTGTPETSAKGLIGKINRDVLIPYGWRIQLEKRVVSEGSEKNLVELVTFSEVPKENLQTESTHS